MYFPLRWTPLHVSAVRDRPAVAEVLLLAGAETELLAGARWTPMHFAARNGNVAVAR